ncbi:hypothetical protein Tco_0412820 [Tanacetum coccineum]
MDTTTERDNPFAELITKNTRSRKGIFKNLHVQMIFEDLFHSQIQEKLNHLPKPEQDQVFTHSQHVDKKPGYLKDGDGDGNSQFLRCQFGLDSNDEDVVPKVEDAPMVDGVSEGAFGGKGDEDFATGEVDAMNVLRIEGKEEDDDEE